MRGGVTDAGRTTKQTVKIELLGRWKLEAEFRKNQRGVPKRGGGSAVWEKFPNNPVNMF